MRKPSQIGLSRDLETRMIIDRSSLICSNEYVCSLFQKSKITVWTFTHWIDAATVMQRRVPELLDCKDSPFAEASIPVVRGLQLFKQSSVMSRRHPTTCSEMRHFNWYQSMTLQMRPQQSPLLLPPPPPAPQSLQRTDPCIAISYVICFNYNCAKIL